MKEFDLENTEMNKEALGYSSEHYKYEYERALASGNMRAAENAKKNWAKAMSLRPEQADVIPSLEIGNTIICGDMDDSAAWVKIDR